ncbi:hypothetical protein BVRB_4g082060 [Beta vulgaris subsp. vulgaris]|nr:hypothetical protein BVRB_4g082060 [Beta vulgaris subsp. vulgaris]
MGYSSEMGTLLNSCFSGPCYPMVQVMRALYVLRFG